VIRKIEIHHCRADAVGVGNRNRTAAVAGNVSELMYMSTGDDTMATGLGGYTVNDTLVPAKA
jgi:hypothetical protein